MIAYASEKGKTEILAWLLDYKNRTADFAAEQKKADRKLMQELNCAPDSVLCAQEAVELSEAGGRHTSDHEL